ncbi:hypothetical protein HDU67_002845 [Dinochytrium kinnereticum]|nr:hypothetical protein HDU67_002845 [Dinochytrium kinnereticum]
MRSRQTSSSAAPCQTTSSTLHPLSAANNDNSKKKRCRTVFSLITPHDYKTGSHTGHNAGATFVSEWEQQQQQQQQEGFSTPPPSPLDGTESDDADSPSAAKKQKLSPSPPSSTSTVSTPSSSLPATDATPAPQGFICPLAHCSATFLRRYNMVQHFRAHAARIGISTTAIERGCKALKGVPEGCVPEFFAVGGGYAR